MCKSTPPLIATPWVAFTHVIGLNKIPHLQHPWELINPVSCLTFSSLDMTYKFLDFHCRKYHSPKEKRRDKREEIKKNKREKKGKKDK